MNIIALILALIALVIFVADHFGARRNNDGRGASNVTVALGLAFLTAAWLAQSLLEMDAIKIGG